MIWTLFTSVVTIIGLVTAFAFNQHALQSVTQNISLTTKLVFTFFQFIICILFIINAYVWFTPVQNVIWQKWYFWLILFLFLSCLVMTFILLVKKQFHYFILQSFCLLATFPFFIAHLYLQDQQKKKRQMSSDMVTTTRSMASDMTSVQLSTDSSSSQSKQLQQQPLSSLKFGTFCALFIDNDKRLFQGVDLIPGLDTLLIDDTAPNEFLETVSDQNPFRYVFALTRQFPDFKSWYDSKRPKTRSEINSFVRSFTYEPKLISNGITLNDELKIKEWVLQKCQTCQHIYLLVDWDRTISVVEGISKDALLWFSEKYYETYGKWYLDFLLGGPIRRERLRQFFHDIRQTCEGVGVILDMYVLTNNGFCTTPTHVDVRERAFFDHFLFMVRSVLGPDFPQDHLICGQYINGTSQMSNKIRFISSLSYTND